VLDASRPADEITGRVVRRVEEMLGKPGGIVHPRPAQGPDTSVQPELSDAELVTMEHKT